MSYNPFDWYWLGDDGRIFASAREIIIDGTDADYQTWVASGNLASAWPRDDAGNQSDDALQDVLTPYNLFASLANYALHKRWLTEQGGITLTSGMLIETDDRAQAKISGAMIAAKYPPAPTKAPPGGGGIAFTTKWHAADGTVWPLDTPAIVAMSGELQLHIDRCFEASSAVIAGIADGSIMTREQVDAAFAGTTTRK